MTPAPILPGDFAAASCPLSTSVALWAAFLAGLPPSQPLALWGTPQGAWLRTGTPRPEQEQVPAAGGRGWPSGEQLAERGAGRVGRSTSFHFGFFPAHVLMAAAVCGGSRGPTRCASLTALCPSTPHSAGQNGGSRRSRASPEVTAGERAVRTRIRVCLTQSLGGAQLTLGCQEPRPDCRGPQRDL